ncbi:MAG: SsrA-binding protein SmpB [Wenzhouxiangellaceae bacterium]|nr:SsrA-binding protein SmpB [Wenzhouxiangellaceae bacterium]
MSSDGSSTIAVNKRARFEYHLEERLEAGVSLMGWEVKSLRAGNAQFGESHVLVRGGEAFLFGCVINPLTSASTHVNTDSMRTRRLLLHKSELNRLIGQVERKGYTLVPTAMYWKNGKVKVEIALAKGKKEHDKRHTEKERDWQREKGRILKQR